MAMSTVFDRIAPSLSQSASAGFNADDSSNVPHITIVIQSCSLIPTGEIPGINLNPVTNVLDYFETYHSFADHNSLVTKNDADTFWVYFRLNNAKSLATSPNISHLSLNDKQREYMRKPDIFKF